MPSIYCLPKLTLVCFWNFCAWHSLRKIDSRHQHLPAHQVQPLMPVCAVVVQLQGRSGWPLDTHLLVNSGHGFPHNGPLIAVGDATRGSPEHEVSCLPSTAI